MSAEPKDDDNLDSVPKIVPLATTRRVVDSPAELETSQLLRLASKDPQHPMLVALREVHQAEVARKDLERKLTQAENDLRDTTQRLLDYADRQPQLVNEAAMLAQDLRELQDRYQDLDQQRAAQVEIYRKYHDELGRVEVEMDRVRTENEIYRKRIEELELVAQEVYELRGLSRLYEYFPQLLKPYWQAVAVGAVVSFIFAFAFLCVFVLFYHRS